MKRLWMIAAVIGLLSFPAFAQEGPRNLAGSGNAVEQTPQQRIQKTIVALYLANFKERVELTDEQFIKVENIASQFIQARFRAANQRNLFKQRRDKLLNQPNPFQADIQQLNDDETTFETQFANIDPQIMKRLQTQLSGRQMLLIREFNGQFFTEQLPRLLDQARAELAANKAQQRPNAPAARANQQQNRKDAKQPGDALRGKNTPVNPVRKNLGK